MMENKRRNKFDIVADILKSTEDEVKPTYIFGNTGLNFAIGKPYVDLMLQHDLLEERESNPSKIYNKAVDIFKQITKM